jgi:uncharacterized protein (TIGR02246 family)
MALLLLVLVGACQPGASELTDEERTAIADTVRQLTVRLIDTWDIPMDPDLFFSLLSDDARWGFNGEFELASSDTSLTRAFMAELASGLTEADQNLENMAVRVLGPDAAVVGGILRYTEVDTAGVAGDGTQAITIIWERVAGQWKVVWGHESDPPPDSV